MYSKIVKYIMWALLVISLVVIVWGVVTGLTANEGQPVDLLLYCAYALIAITLIAILLAIVISCVQDKKVLLKIAIILVVGAAIIGGAYALAPASPAVGLVGKEPTFSELKLTDTVLNLTYLIGGAAIVAILFSAIYNAIRK